MGKYSVLSRWRWTQKIIKIQKLLKAYLESISPMIWMDLVIRDIKLSGKNANLTAFKSFINKLKLSQEGLYTYSINQGKYDIKLTFKIFKDSKSAFLTINTYPKLNKYEDGNDIINWKYKFTGFKRIPDLLSLFITPEPSTDKLDLKIKVEKTVKVADKDKRSYKKYYKKNNWKEK